MCMPAATHSALFLQRREGPAFSLPRGQRCAVTYRYPSCGLPLPVRQSGWRRLQPSSAASFSLCLRACSLPFVMRNADAWRRRGHFDVTAGGRYRRVCSPKALARSGFRLRCTLLPFCGLFPLRCAFVADFPPWGSLFGTLLLVRSAGDVIAIPVAGRRDVTHLRCLPSLVRWASGSRCTINLVYGAFNGR